MPKAVTPPKQRKNYVSVETDTKRKMLAEYGEGVHSAIATEVGTDVSGLEKDAAIEKIVVVECINDCKLPGKQSKDEAAISARRTELTSYKPELLRAFAIKRGIYPDDKTPEQMVEAILDVEY